MNAEKALKTEAKCNRCGADVPDAARFCPSCGVRLADASPSGNEREKTDADRIASQWESADVETRNERDRAVGVATDIERGLSATVSPGWQSMYGFGCGGSCIWLPELVFFLFASAHPWLWIPFAGILVFGIGGTVRFASAKKALKAYDTARAAELAGQGKTQMLIAAGCALVLFLAELHYVCLFFKGFR